MLVTAINSHAMLKFIQMIGLNTREAGENLSSNEEQNIKLFVP